jgi:hypothetical protein
LFREEDLMEDQGGTQRVKLKSMNSSAVPASRKRRLSPDRRWFFEVVLRHNGYL